MIFIWLSTHVKTQGHRVLSHQYQHFIPDTWPLLQPILSTHHYLFKTNWYISVSKALSQYISFTPVCLYKSDLQAHFMSILFRRYFHFISQDSLLTHLLSVQKQEWLKFLRSAFSLKTIKVQHSLQSCLQSSLLRKAFSSLVLWQQTLAQAVSLSAPWLQFQVGRSQ